MTLVLKPIHLVIVAFLLGALFAGSAALLLAGGGDSGPAETVIAQPTATGVDEAPTQAPAAAAPTQAPAAPAPEPIIRSCDEIRAAGDYLNPEERAFFLAECTNAPAAPAAAGPAPTAPEPPAAPGQTGPTEAERNYRAKAEGQMVAYAFRFYQYAASPSQGAVGDILELGSITRNWGNQLTNFEPAPPRFKAAHDQLKAALFAYSDQMMKITNVQTNAQFNAWAAGADAVADRLIAALNDYGLVVGIDF